MVLDEWYVGLDFGLSFEWIDCCCERVDNLCVECVEVKEDFSPVHFKACPL
jgi:hypothetical protein